MSGAAGSFTSANFAGRTTRGGATDTLDGAADMVGESLRTRVLCCDVSLSLSWALGGRGWVPLIYPRARERAADARASAAAQKNRIKRARSARGRSAGAVECLCWPG